ncbi:MAG: hypothetical protein DMF97_05275 [Acidobacteria bacterium]|nr:MAG: hypothetical protein DMF97_05275 [Acidobacteriota bacterium]
MTRALPVRRLSALRVLVALVLLTHAAAAHADIISFTKRAASEKFDQAVAALGRGDLKQADTLFQQVVESDPLRLYAALGHAQVALSQQRIKDADRAISAVLSQHAEMAEAHNMKGVVLLLQKRQEDARYEFSRAVELQARYVTPRIYLAALARESGRFADASSAYKALTDVAPGLPAGYVGQAEALMMMGKTPEAYTVLDAWKAHARSSVLPYQVLGSLYLANGERAKAVQELKAALVKNPGDAPTLKLLGDAYAASGDFKAAGEQYDAAVAADPKNVEAVIRTGDLKARAGQTDRALEIYRRAIAIDPTNPVACNNVAWLLGDQGQQLDEALRLAQVAAKAGPAYVDAQDTLGWVYYQRGHYSQAVTTLKNAKALDGKRTDVAAHLGLAYAKAGLTQQALAELKRALASTNAVPNRAELERTVASLSR